MYIGLGVLFWLVFVAAIIVIITRHGRHKHPSEDDVLRVLDSLVSSGQPHGEADVAAELGVYLEELQPALEAMYEKGILVVTDGPPPVEQGRAA
jgi:hypothetical protein